MSFVLEDVFDGSKARKKRSNTPPKSRTLEMLGLGNETGNQKPVGTPQKQPGIQAYAKGALPSIGAPPPQQSPGLRVRDFFLPNHATVKATANAYNEGGLLGVLKGAARHVVSNSEPVVRDFTRAPINVIAGKRVGERLVPPIRSGARSDSIVPASSVSNENAAPPASASQSPGGEQPGPDGQGAGSKPKNRVVVRLPDGTTKEITKPEHTANYMEVLDKDGNAIPGAVPYWSTRGFIQRAARQREASLRAQGYNLEAMAEGGSYRPRTAAETLPALRRTLLRDDKREAADREVAEANADRRQKSRTLELLNSQAQEREKTERLKAKGGFLSAVAQSRGATRAALIGARSDQVNRAAEAGQQIETDRANTALDTLQEMLTKGVLIVDKKGRPKLDKAGKPVYRQPTREEVAATRELVASAFGYGSEQAQAPAS